MLNKINKMIYQYYNFINEVNSNKLQKFKDPKISNLFTTSIEIEIETDEIEEGDYIDYTKKELSNIISLIKNKSISEISKEGYSLNENDMEFMDILLSEVSNAYDDEDYLNTLLNPKKYKKESRKLIVTHIKDQSLLYFSEYNFTSFTKSFKSSFPNFIRNWGTKFKFEFDNSLYKGIELSNLKYFDSISTLINCIYDFYSDYKNQSIWKFTKKTGIHINLGIKNNPDYNLIKGLLFLDDMGESPFVFKQMEWRQNSEYTKSIKEKLPNSKRFPKSIIELKKGNIKECENILNNEIIEITKKIGYKKFGINFLSLESKNYIEFRYPGGEIDEEVLVDKIYYFSYIIYIMVNPDVDKQEYQKKLYKFLNHV